MAEFAASIVAFIHLADSVIRVCSYFISNARDAPRDMVIISSEVTSLRAILSCFNKNDLHPKTAEALPTLFASPGAIQACYKSVTALERLLPTVPDDATRKMSFNMSDLAWALKEPQVRKHEIKDVKAGVERVEQVLTRSERTEALEWLQSKCHNPSAIHNSIFENHEEHTSSWLYKWEKWNSWLQLDNTPEDHFLWIHGIPGAGKSVLASFIVESIRSHCEHAANRRLGYAYYYCHYSRKEDDGSPFLRWVIGRLSRQAEWAPPQLKSLRDSGHEPTITELLMVLQPILDRFSAVYVVVDGVDESEPRTQMLSVLTTLATDERFQNIRLLATSRLHQDIERAFSGISASISMSNSFVCQDIQTVVHKFRWVACQMQITERIREESQLIDALNSLPQDLDQVYIRLLDEIPDADHLFVRRVLLWIAGHASSGRLRDQGIHIETLITAVCDDLQHMTGNAYRYTAEDVRELCGCLITVEERRLPFTDFLTELHFTPGHGGECIIYKEDYPEDAPKGYFVKIAHYTVMEFLASDRIAASPARPFSMASVDIRAEFFRSVLRQSLTADPAGASADWVRDREPYCLTLAPLIIPNVNFSDPDVLNLCVRYFLPTSPHFPRLRRIQCYLAAGCDDAQSFYLARLPVYNPTLPPSEYQRNDPNVWALLGPLAAATAAPPLAREATNYPDMNGEHLLPPTKGTPEKRSLLPQQSELNWYPPNR
ncbi:hypothetical protein DL767_002016 [Monosporascus sp. MG133]|nr:hypothetical protein DL767_002016 [Monosporascus sp. MG133]